MGDICFGNRVMYTMNYNNGSISKFAGSGNLVEARWATIPEDRAPESCVLDSAGNLFVGEDDVPGHLVKVSAGARSETSGISHCAAPGGRSADSRLVHDGDAQRALPEAGLDDGSTQ